MRAGTGIPGAAISPDPDAVAVGEIVGAHALRGLLRVRPYQPDTPTLAEGRRIMLERDGSWSEADVTHAGAHGRGTSRYFVGSVADKVLRSSGLPILLRRSVPAADPARWATPPDSTDAANSLASEARR